jgi:hypothetical protein
MRYRAGHPKHRYYLENRKRYIAKLDHWDQYMLEHIKPGKTIAWDVSGYYLQDFVKDLVVVEKYPIVLDWAPNCVMDYDENQMIPLLGSADNLIIININELRWKNIDYWTHWWCRRTVYLRPGAQIFFSFRENRLLRNRLKEKFSDIMDSWLPQMETHGFKLKYYNFEAPNISTDITDHRSAPEITDAVNGNLKIHWEYCLG